MTSPEVDPHQQSAFQFSGRPPPLSDEAWMDMSHKSMDKHNGEELWFQQDGATCHTARATIDLLKDTFGDRLISRFGPVVQRSCD
ncbi:hypothetical protein TNCV_1800071 [Trichonephila clavipes]|nr:hypothetical protein TNCV_1800071 [Trichonephila clavipes]